MKLATLRIRNEAVIIQSTLDRLKNHFDGAVILDDVSEDGTLDIISSDPFVKSIIRTGEWSPNPEVRKQLETSQRQHLHDYTVKKFNPDWILYLDGDEHMYFDEILFQDNVTYWFKLFHVYITPEDVDKHFLERRMVGPEYVHIPMLFQPPARFYNRIPRVNSRFTAEGGTVKHFGKGISVRHWEDTCDYYINHLNETMADGGSISEKWAKRKGKAVHTKSDFGNDLIDWAERYQDKIVPELSMYK